MNPAKTRTVISERRIAVPVTPPLRSGGNDERKLLAPSPPIMIGVGDNPRGLAVGPCQPGTASN